MQTRDWGRRLFLSWVRLGWDIPEEPREQRALLLAVRAVASLTGVVEGIANRNRPEAWHKDLVEAVLPLFALARYYDVDLEELLEQKVIAIEGYRPQVQGAPEQAPTPADVLNGLPGPRYG